MSKALKVHIVHDVTGQIISVNRVMKEGRVAVLGGAGNLVFEAEIDEQMAAEGITSRFRVDTMKKELVPNR